MILAHLSDTHVKPPGELAYGVVDTAAALRRAVATILAVAPRPDAALITGDLVDAGSAEEYAHLRQLLAPLLAAMPVYLLPGNHDEREALRGAFGDCVPFPAEGEHLHYAASLGPVRVLALDTLVPGEPGGLVCPSRLAWLDAALGAEGGTPTIVAMHHPPFLTGIAHMDAMGLDGRDAFAAVIARHPQVERILCGHLHRAISARVGGTIASTCPGASHQVALDLGTKSGPPMFVLEPPVLQLHVYRPFAGLVTHAVPIGDFDGPYPFRTA